MDHSPTSDRDGLIQFAQYLVWARTALSKKTKPYDLIPTPPILTDISSIDLRWARRVCDLLANGTALVALAAVLAEERAQHAETVQATHNTSAKWYDTQIDVATARWIMNQRAGASTDSSKAMSSLKSLQAEIGRLIRNGAPSQFYSPPVPIDSLATKVYSGNYPAIAFCFHVLFVTYVYAERERRMHEMLQWYIQLADTYCQPSLLPRTVTEGLKDVTAVSQFFRDGRLWLLALHNYQYSRRLFSPKFLNSRDRGVVALRDVILRPETGQERQYNLLMWSAAMKEEEVHNYFDLGPLGGSATHLLASTLPKSSQLGAHGHVVFIFMQSYLLYSLIKNSNLALFDTREGRLIANEYTVRQLLVAAARDDRSTTDVTTERVHTQDYFESKVHNSFLNGVCPQDAQSLDELGFVHKPPNFFVSNGRTIDPRSDPEPNPTSPVATACTPVAYIVPHAPGKQVDIDFPSPSQCLPEIDKEDNASHSESIIYVKTGNSLSVHTNADSTRKNKGHTHSAINRVRKLNVSLTPRKSATSASVVGKSQQPVVVNITDIDKEPSEEKAAGDGSDVLLSPIRFAGEEHCNALGHSGEVQSSSIPHGDEAVQLVISDPQDGKLRLHSCEQLHVVAAFSDNTAALTLRTLLARTTAALSEARSGTHLEGTTASEPHIFWEMPVFSNYTSMREVRKSDNMRLNASHSWEASFQVDEVSALGNIGLQSAEAQFIASPYAAALRARPQQAKVIENRLSKLYSQRYPTPSIRAFHHISLSERQEKPPSRPVGMSHSPLMYGGGGPFRIALRNITSCSLSLSGDQRAFVSLTVSCSSKDDSSLLCLPLPHGRNLLREGIITLVFVFSGCNAAATKLHKAITEDSSFVSNSIVP